MANFVEGDVVRLKSGGPAMTVSSCEDDGFGEMKVFCAWFDKGVEKSGAFKPAMVEKVERDRGGGGAKDGWMA